MTLFASWHLPALIILLTIAEAFAVRAFHRRTGRGPTLAAILPNLLAGDCLLAALAFALAHTTPGLIAAALAASLGCHLADLARWRYQPLVSSK